MKNLIDCLWEELEIFLEDDKGFKIVEIKNDLIIIKSLSKEAFHIRWIYCSVLSAIIPSNCTLEINSVLKQANDMKDDYFKFNLKIETKKCLYKGTIKIIK